MESKIEEIKIAASPHAAALVIYFKERQNSFGEVIKDWYWKIPEWGIAEDSYFRTQEAALEHGEQVRAVLGWYGETYAAHCFPRK